jgi:hypothetical protein
VFWFVLPAALLVGGISRNYIDSYNYSGNPDIYNKATTGYYATMAGYGAMGVSLAGTFFFIFRYLYHSGADAAPLARFPDPPQLDFPSMDPPPAEPPPAEEQ